MPVNEALRTLVPHTADTDRPDPVKLTDPRSNFSAATVIDADGRLTAVPPSGGFLEGVQSDFLEQGQGISGRLGLADLPNLQGLIAESSASGIYHSWKSGLDVEEIRRREPGFSPVPDDELETVSSKVWYDRTVPKSYKDVLSAQGFDADYFGAGDADGLEAERRMGYALFMSRRMQINEAFERSDPSTFKSWSTGIGSAVLSIAADPVTWLSLGAAGAGKAAVKEGSKAALVRVAGTKVSLRDGILKTVVAGAKFAGEHPKISALGAGATNALVGQMRASQADDRLKSLGIENSEYLSPQGVAIDALVGAGLHFGFTKLFGSTKSIVDRELIAARDATQTASTINVSSPSSLVNAGSNALKWDTLEDALSNWFGNDQAFWSNYLHPLSLAEFERVGLTTDQIIDFIRTKRPSQDEFIDLLETTRQQIRNGVQETVPNEISEYSAQYRKFGSTQGTPLEFDSSLDKALYMLARNDVDPLAREKIYRYVAAVLPKTTNDQIHNLSGLVKSWVDEQIRVTGSKSFRFKAIFDTSTDVSTLPKAPKTKLSTKPVPTNTSTRGFGTGETEYTLAQKQYNKLFLEERDLLSKNQNEQSVIDRLKEVRSQMAGPRSVIEKTRSDAPAAPARLEIQIPEAPQGSHLNPEMSSAALDKVKSRIFADTVTPNFTGLVPSWVKLAGIKGGGAVTGDGRGFTVYSPISLVRTVSDLVIGSPLTRESASGQIRKVRSLLEGNREQHAITASHRRRNLKILKPFARQEREAILTEAMYRARGLTSGPVDPRNARSKAVADIAKNLRENLDAWGDRGVRSNYLRKPLENYVPAFFKPSAKPYLDEIVEKVRASWVQDWLAPDADLHVGTLERIGLVKDGKFMADVFGTSVDVPTKLADLPPLLQEQYLANVRLKDGAIGRQARLSVSKRFSLKIPTLPGDEYLSEIPSVDGLMLDSAKGRAIEDRVWWTSDLLPFVETDPDIIMGRYGESTGYGILRQETANAVTGRRDVKWEDLFEWFKVQALDQAGPQNRDQVQKAFTVLGYKDERLHGHSSPDGSAVLSVLNGLVTTGVNIARSAVAAVNAAQQVITETPQILLHAGMSRQDQRAAITSFARSLKSGSAGPDVLNGLSYALEGSRQATARGVISPDLNTTYARDWMDKAVRLPSRRMAEVLTDPETTTAQKSVNSLMALSDMVASLSRAVGLEDYFNTATKAMTVGVEKSRLSRSFSKIQKLSTILAQENLDTNFVGAARRAGFSSPTDIVYARRLNQAGLLDPVVVSDLSKIASLDKHAISAWDASKTFDYDHLSSLISSLPEHGDRLNAAASLRKAYQFIENRVDRLSVRPDVSDTAAGPMVSNPLYRATYALTAWTRGWFNKRLIDEIGNNPLHTAYGAVGLGVMLELLYMQGNKYLYKGFSIEDLEDEWDTSPGSVAMQLAQRTNLAGPLQEIAFFIANEFGQFDERVKAPFGTNIAQASAVGTFQSIMKAIRRPFDSSKPLSEKDYRNYIRILPGVNSPFIQGISKVSGYKSTAELLQDAFGN